MFDVAVVLAKLEEEADLLIAREQPESTLEDLPA